MLKSTFVIPTASFSRLFVAPDREPLKRYYCVAPLAGIPKAWQDWLEVNAREAADKGKVPTAIRKTLVDNPGWFAEKNRGLTVIAHAVAWDNKTKELTVSFVDREQHGVADGGHTLISILSQRSDEPSEVQEGYCNIEIFTGLDSDEIPGVVEARNTSKQVASKSLLNLDHRFDELKDAIGSKKAELISWKENEDGDLDVREFIGMLTALDADFFTGNNHPVVAYSGKESCLKRFASVEHAGSYTKLLEIAPDLLDIWDDIQFFLPDQYNQKGPEPGVGGKFGRLSGIKTLGTKKKKKLAFIDKDVGYDIPTGYLYPVFAAFRAFLEEENGYWRWGKGLDPRALINDGLAADLFIASVRDSISEYHNANRTGKSNAVWNQAYLVARNYYLERP